MEPGRETSGSSGGDIGLSRLEVWDAVNAFVKVRNQYADSCSDSVKQKIDAFVNTVPDDLKTSVQQHGGEQSETIARQHLLAAFDKLNQSVNEALGLDRLPIK